MFTDFDYDNVGIVKGTLKGVKLWSKIPLKLFVLITETVCFHPYDASHNLSRYYAKEKEGNGTRYAVIVSLSVPVSLYVCASVGLSVCLCLSRGFQNIRLLNEDLAISKRFGYMARITKDGNLTCKTWSRHSHLTRTFAWSLRVLYSCTRFSILLIETTSRW